MTKFAMVAMGGLLALVATPNGNADPTRYSGMCDASAAVPISDTKFAVASDEDSVLRIYRRDLPGDPLQSADLREFLAIDDPETDLEGATRVGDRIYWISSHGLNGDAEPQPNRRRFFATDIKVEGETVSLVPFGKPYSNLVDDMVRSEDLKAFKLAEAANKAPEAEGGLNIEGMTRMPKGGLLLGFRNPIPSGKALLVPLENPDEAVSGEPAHLGKPVLLELGGLGIRSLEYRESSGNYLIVAGPPDDGEDSRLYSWSGSPGDYPEVLPGKELAGLRPEALIVYPEARPGLQVLSDDGGVKLDGKKCKKADRAKQGFQSVVLTLPAPN